MKTVRVTLDDATTDRLQREYAHFCSLLRHIAPEYQPCGFGSYVRSRVSGINLLREDIIKNALEGGIYQEVKKQLGGRFDTFITDLFRSAGQCGFSLSHQDGDNEISLSLSCKHLSSLIASHFRLGSNETMEIEKTLRTVVRSAGSASGEALTETRYRVQQALLELLLELQMGGVDQAQAAKARFDGFISGMTTVGVMDASEAERWRCRFDECMANILRVRSARTNL